MNQRDQNGTLGDRIKLFAKTNYGSVSALTRAIGVGPTALAHYISGEYELGAEMLAKLKKVGFEANCSLTEIPTKAVVSTEEHKQEEPPKRKEVITITTEVHKQPEPCKYKILAESLQDMVDQLVVEKIELTSQVNLLKSIIEHALTRPTRV